MYVSDSILIIVSSFLVGSIPFGVVLAKLFKLPDPRAIGSGNIGATNMLRTGRKDVAALTLLLDALKGVLPVLFVMCTLKASPATGALTLLCALAGHCYTPWLKGKGGKGVATAVGGAIAISWMVGVGFCFAFLAVFFMTRWVSLASIAGLLALPVGAYITMDTRTAFVLAIASCISIWRHRANIARLREGTEPKL